MSCDQNVRTWERLEQAASRCHRMCKWVVNDCVLGCILLHMFHSVVCCSSWILQLVITILLSLSSSNCSFHHSRPTSLSWINLWSLDVTVAGPNPSITCQRSIRNLLSSQEYSAFLYSKWGEGLVLLYCHCYYSSVVTTSVIKRVQFLI